MLSNKSFSAVVNGAEVEKYVQDTTHVLATVNLKGKTLVLYEMPWKA